VTGLAARFEKVIPVAQRTTFAKLQRERARKAKAEEKRAKREGRDPVPTTTTVNRAPTTSVGVPRIPDGQIHPDQLLRLVEQLSAAHAAGMIDDDEFEDMKLELMTRV